MPLPAALLAHARKAHEQAAGEVASTTRAVRPHVVAMLTPVLDALTGATDYATARRALLRAAKVATPRRLAPTLLASLERGYRIGETSATAELG